MADKSEAGGKTSTAPVMPAKAGIQGRIALS